VNLLPEVECITTVECGSWFAMASNIGNGGKVDAILGNCEAIRLVERN
jgi:hypothetical protein